MFGKAARHMRRFRMFGKAYSSDITGDGPCGAVIGVGKGRRRMADIGVSADMAVVSGGAARVSYYDQWWQVVDVTSSGVAIVSDSCASAVGLAECYSIGDYEIDIEEMYGDWSSWGPTDDSGGGEGCGDGGKDCESSSEGEEGEGAGQGSDGCNGS